MTELVVWWFLSYSIGFYNKGTATMVGPFRNQAECERVRMEVGRKFQQGVDAYTLGCWGAPK